MAQMQLDHGRCNDIMHFRDLKKTVYLKSSFSSVTSLKKVGMLIHMIIKTNLLDFNRVHGVNKSNEQCYVRINYLLVFFPGRTVKIMCEFTIRKAYLIRKQYSSIGAKDFWFSFNVSTKCQ